MSTRLRYEDVLPNARLFLELVRGSGPLADLLPPATGAALDEHTRAAAARALPRAELAAAITARLRSLDAPEEALAAAERLGAGGSAAVVTGQQPGLLGGPHMVLGKALSAVALARRLESRTGVPTVPIFWSAAEDHDHAEGDHVDVLVAGGARERLRLPLPEDRRMLSRVPVPPGAAALIESLGQGAARFAPRPGDSMADWSARVLLSLLGRLGVVLVEPATLAPFATSVLRHELEHPGDIASTVRAAEQRVLDAGHLAPLDLSRDELFFAVGDDGRRVIIEAVDATDGGFGARGEPATPLPELLARLREDPPAFSWNVASRVLAQDQALPVAAQVCGPSELTYVALLGAAHERLGIRRPAAVARGGVTVVDRGVARACAALEVAPAAVVLGGEAAFPGTGEAPVSESLTALRSAVAGLPGSTDRAVARRKGALERDVEQYAAALARAEERAQGVTSERRRRALTALRPRGRLQERSLSALPWVLRHGDAVVDAMLEALEQPGAEHAIVELGGGAPPPRSPETSQAAEIGG